MESSTFIFVLILAADPARTLGPAVRTLSRDIRKEFTNAVDGTTSPAERPLGGRRMYCWGAVVGMRIWVNCICLGRIRRRYEPPQRKSYFRSWAQVRKQPPPPLRPGRSRSC